MASRLTVLYGSSGVGKSSLLRAGVARRLRADFASGAVGTPSSSAPRGRAISQLCARGADRMRSATHHRPRTETRSPTSSRSVCRPRRGDLRRSRPARGVRPLSRPEPRRPSGGDTRRSHCPTDLRVDVLLGIRDDALAQLDAFKVRVPASSPIAPARPSRPRSRPSAILGPLEEFARPGAARMTVEPQLVEAVLDEVAAGRIAIVDGRGLFADAAANGVSRRLICSS